MKIDDIILEERKRERGSYLAVKFSDKTNKAIVKYMKDNDIPNPLKPEKLHTTVLYSRKYLPNLQKTDNNYKKPLIGIPTTFDVWPTQNADHEQTKCLIIKFKCKELEQRHKDLMKEHEATYYYDEYKTHITLSYDIGDTDIKDLPSFKNAVPEIEIVKEYYEELNLNWAATKSKN